MFVLASSIQVSSFLAYKVVVDCLWCACPEIKTHLQRSVSTTALKIDNILAIYAIVIPMI